MKLHLVRDLTENGATLGRLAVDGVFECWTLEDAVRERAGRPVAEWKIAGSTAIPRGEYVVIVDRSQRFKRDLPRLLNVPGFEGVRIHAGNTQADTEGCILVGQARGRGRVDMSRLAFEQLFQKLTLAQSRGEEITIEVK